MCLYLCATAFTEAVICCKPLRRRKSSNKVDRTTVEARNFHRNSLMEAILMLAGDLVSDVSRRRLLIRCIEMGLAECIIRSDVHVRAHVRYAQNC